MRWFVLAAAFAGVVAALLFPTAGSAGHILYKAWITPPTGYQFEEVKLTCGWHGSCGASSGWGLDWAPTSTANSYFRGGFYRSSGAFSGQWLMQDVYRVTIDPQTQCDEMASDLWERPGAGYANNLRFGMHHVHVYLSTPLGVHYYYDVYTDSTSDGYFGSYYVSAATPYADAGCSWGGQHVHDLAYVGTLPGYAINPSIPYGDYCEPSIPGSCQMWWNWAYMRYFEWGSVN